MDSPISLEPLEREAILRLKAEWDLASSRVEIARHRFERLVETVARAHGVQGEFELNVDQGQIQPKSGSPVK